MSERGRVRQCEVWPGMAGPGMAWLSKVYPWLGVAVHGTVRRGEVGLGNARSG